MLLLFIFPFFQAERFPGLKAIQDEYKVVESDAAMRDKAPQDAWAECREQRRWRQEVSLLTQDKQIELVLMRCHR